MMPQSMAVFRGQSEISSFQLLTQYEWPYKASGFTSEVEDQLGSKITAASRPCLDLFFLLSVFPLSVNSLFLPFLSQCLSVSLICLSFIFASPHFHPPNLLLPFTFSGYFSFLLPFLPPFFSSQPTNREGTLIDLPQVSCPSTPPSPPPLPSLAHSSFSQPAPDKKGAEVILFGHFWNWSHQSRLFSPPSLLILPVSLDIHSSPSLITLILPTASISSHSTHLAFSPCIFFPEWVWICT